MLKANYCISCSKLINKHCPEAIPDDECLLKVIECGWYIVVGFTKDTTKF